MELPMTRNNPRSNGLPGLLVFALCFGIAVAGWGQSDPVTSTPSPSDSAQTGAAQADQQSSRPPTIAIGAGDQLDVEVFDTPELSGASRVSQTGEINIAVLGNVQVAGLTPNQAARKIEAELKSHGILIDPHVTVAICRVRFSGSYSDRPGARSGCVSDRRKPQTSRHDCPGWWGNPYSRPSCNHYPSG